MFAKEKRFRIASAPGEGDTRGSSPPEFGERVPGFREPPL